MCLVTFLHIMKPLCVQQDQGSVGIIGMGANPNPYSFGFGLYGGTEIKAIIGAKESIQQVGFSSSVFTFKMKSWIWMCETFLCCLVNFGCIL